jgi:hypothetical protein
MGEAALSRRRRTSTIPAARQPGYFFRITHSPLKETAMSERNSPQPVMVWSLAAKARATRNASPFSEASTDHDARGVTQPLSKPLRQRNPDPVRGGSVENFVFAVIAFVLLAASTMLAGTLLGARTAEATEGSRHVASRTDAVGDVPRVQAISTFASEPLTVSAPWPFESKSPQAGTPGRARRDRLSAPEWTSDAVGTEYKR